MAITDEKEQGYSYSETVVENEYNAKGQLTGAVGVTGGRTNGGKVSTVVLNAEGNGIKNDGNGDGIQDVGEAWEFKEEVQWSAFSGDNTYGVVMGQAVLLKSVTKSWALDEVGGAIPAGAAGFNTSVTTVQYGYNGKGQMTGAEGETEGDSENGKVLTVKQEADGTIKGDDGDGIYEANEPWEFEVAEHQNKYKTWSRYGVMGGQALVVKSFTRSWVVGINGVALGEDEHGYSLSESTVRNYYTGEGQLEGAAGWTVGVSNAKVLKDSRVNGVDYENQRTESMTKNVYGVVMGQAVVMKGVTQSWTAGSDGKRISDVGSHGYNRTVTTVYNKYNETGQLEAAKGGSTGLTNVEGLKDSRVSQDEWADQLTETETRNVYAVVRGQAVVLMSVTESWSAGSDGQRIVNEEAHGYSYSKTTVVNQYNVDGQMIGATGRTESKTTQGTFKSVEDWAGALLGG